MQLNVLRAPCLPWTKGSAIGRRMVREWNKFLATPVTKGVSLYITTYKKTTSKGHISCYACKYRHLEAWSRTNTSNIKTRKHNPKLISLSSGWSYTKAMQISREIFLHKLTTKYIGTPFWWMLLAGKKPTQNQKTAATNNKSSTDIWL